MFVVVAIYQSHALVCVILYVRVFVTVSKSADEGIAHSGIEQKTKLCSFYTTLVYLVELL